MKRAFIVFIMTVTIAGSIHAGISYTPSVKIYSTIALCRNLTLEHEPLACRTSFAMNVEASPLSMTIAHRHTISLTARFSSLADSVKYMNTMMLGSRRLGIGVEYEVRLAMFALGVDIGVGYAVVNRQDIGYAYTDTGISASVFVDDAVALSLDVGFIYRREYLETHIGIALKLMLPPGVVGR